MRELRLQKGGEITVELHEIFGNRVDDMDEDRIDQARIVTQVGKKVKEEILEEVEEVEWKVDSTVST